MYCANTAIIKLQNCSVKKSQAFCQDTSRTVSSLMYRCSLAIGKTEVQHKHMKNLQYSDQIKALSCIVLCLINYEYLENRMKTGQVYIDSSQLTPI